MLLPLLGLWAVFSLIPLISDISILYNMSKAKFIASIFMYLFLGPFASFLSFFVNFSELE
jgi:hypothetical protein